MASRVLRVVSEEDFELLERLKRGKEEEKKEKLKGRMVGGGEVGPGGEMKTRAEKRLIIDPQRKNVTLNSLVSQLKSRGTKEQWQAWKILSALFDSAYTSWTPRATLVYLGIEYKFSNIISLLNLLLDLDSAYFQLPAHAQMSEALTSDPKVLKVLGKAIIKFLENSPKPKLNVLEEVDSDDHDVNK
jgi:hypothetical protein